MMRSTTANEGNPSSSSAAPYDCDVALGLKMRLQPTESYSCDGGVSFFSYRSNRSDNSPRSFHSTADFTASSGGGGMPVPVSGKAVFTATQWQELERQQMIHKYIMASVPVPPQLLFAPSLSPPVVPQSNTTGLGLDLRFSSTGSDPEPWRCRRTDGKKWRCSRDVAPDQKYCDRHAHKSRSRSRKPVELPASHNAAKLHPSSYDQSRFIKSGSRNSAAAVHACTGGAQQPWQQLIQTSSKNKDNNLESMSEQHSVQRNEDGQGVLRRFENASFQTTHCIDDDLEGIANKFWPSSLTLSIPGGSGADDQENETDSNLGIGMPTMNPTEGVLKTPPWMNPWVHPGGPLGEALCLGNASVTSGGSNLASPHSSKSNAFNLIG